MSEDTDRSGNAGTPDEATAGPSAATPAKRRGRVSGRKAVAAGAALVAVGAGAGLLWPAGPEIPDEPGTTSPTATFETEADQLLRTLPSSGSVVELESALDADTLANLVSEVLMDGSAGPQLSVPELSPADAHGMARSGDWGSWKIVYGVDGLWRARLTSTGDADTSAMVDDAAAVVFGASGESRPTDEGGELYVPEIYGAPAVDLAVSGWIDPEQGHSVVEVPLVRLVDRETVDLIGPRDAASRAELVVASETEPGAAKFALSDASPSWVLHINAEGQRRLLPGWDVSGDTYQGRLLAVEPGAQGEPVDAAVEPSEQGDPAPFEGDEPEVVTEQPSEADSDGPPQPVDPRDDPHVGDGQGPDRGGPAPTDGGADDDASSTTD